MVQMDRQHSPCVLTGLVRAAWSWASLEAVGRVYPNGLGHLCGSLQFAWPGGLGQCIGGPTAPVTGALSPGIGRSPQWAGITLSVPTTHGILDDHTWGTSQDPVALAFCLFAVTWGASVFVGLGRTMDGRAFQPGRNVGKQGRF